MFAGPVHVMPVDLFSLLETLCAKRFIASFYGMHIAYTSYISWPVAYTPSWHAWIRGSPAPRTVAWSPSKQSAACWCSSGHAMRQCVQMCMYMRVS